MAEEIRVSQMELYKEAKAKNWVKCIELLNWGVKTDCSDQHGQNAFILAVNENQTAVVRLMLEKDPRVLSKNAALVEKYIRKIISGDYFRDRLMFELLLTGNPKASELMGSYYVIHCHPRLATHYFYDRMTPTAPRAILIARYLETLVRKDTRVIFNLFAKYGDLQGEEYVCIASLLIANTDNYKVIYKLTKVFGSKLIIPPQSIFDLLKMLVLAHHNSEREEKSYLGKAIEKVALHLFFKLESFSEDLVLRLVVLLDGTDYKNTLLVRFILHYAFDNSDLLEILHFFVDRCRCDPNYKGENDNYVLLIDSGWNRLDLEPVVRFLLDRGAHPCVRNKNGLPAFDLFPSVGLPAIGVRTLRCIAASKVVEAKIKYGEEDLPKEMHKFLDLH